MSENTSINGSLALEKPAPIVKVIKATNAPTPDRLRVAAYARVSSNSDDQLNSFAAQVKHYNDLIQSEDTWVMVDVYADEGITGTSMKKREDFKRLMNDCRRGQIDMILCKSLSRFARNAVDCLVAIRELKRLGITIRFEKENIDTAQMRDETITAFYATFAQQESESISGNMRWSYQRRMQSGQFVTCKPPFGYDMVDGKLVLNPANANIIKDIFSSYISGESLDSIASRINGLGIPTGDGKPVWTRSTLTYIIKNEKYCGNALLQKKYTTATLPFEKKRNRGEVAQYYVEGSHPPIISTDDFEAAQALCQRRTPNTAVPRKDYPLSKMMYCEECGSVFSRKKSGETVSWCCRAHAKDSRLCSAKPIPESEVYAAFLRLYYKLSVHQEQIITPMIKQLQALKRNRMLWSKELVEITNQIADITEQDRKLNGLKATQNVDPAYFIHKSTALADKLRTLKLEKERLMTQKADTSLEDLQFLVTTLNGGPDFLPEFDKAIFSAITERITVSSDRQLKIHLIGGLILSEETERMEI
ncbi:recombinase family protein [Oscillibacter sp.]|uniref:recombinase family protein n=1 Tax=Oscillibacter sp. TaxID=1945593 RepID=UPI00289A19C6|nr:recombinase family protein [Oscillibacter sp.]